MPARLRLIPIVVLILVTLGADKVQAAAVCSNTPTATQNIKCVEAVSSTDDITIDTTDVTITTTEERESAIKGEHNGDGDVSITVDNATLDTSGQYASGVDGSQSVGFFSADPGGKRTVRIIVKNSTIGTMGNNASGIYGLHFGNHNQGFDNTGDVWITSTNTDITTSGSFAAGIEGKSDYSNGDVIIEMTGGSITTTGSGGEAPGIRGNAEINGTGDVHITVKNATITTGDPGVQALNSKVDGGDIYITLENAVIMSDDHAVDASGDFFVKSDITVKVKDSRLTTDGLISHGIFIGQYEGTAKVDVRDTDITTLETDTDPDYLDTFSHGIYVRHFDIGDIDIDVRGGNIDTRGVDSFGIYARHGTSQDDGDIMVDTYSGNLITTSGDGGHGIFAVHNGAETKEGEIRITVGGDIKVMGAGAQGVRVGRVSTSGIAQGTAAIDSNGFRKQTVTVNGVITSAAEGIYLAGGGRVIIGSKGVINSPSKIAILATGDNPAADPMDPPIKPKLRVDLNLGGRRVVQALGDAWIINDGGETTIAVNRTVLHDGIRGVTGATARNGAWNVRMLEHGVRVDDRADPDPANWVFTDSTDAAPIIVDRDFSTQDFTETRRPIPPPPSSCPDGQMGTPPDCTDAETDTDTDTEMPMFMEEYAPRSALYESLPGFLLRMADRGRLNHRPVSPVWMVFSGGDGSVDPSRSTTGAEYDYDRYRAQLGKNLSLGEGLDGWFAVHYTQGDSEVSSPTGGGDIDAEGAGATFNIQWQHASGYYLGAHASLTNYDIDLSSDDVGRLRSSVDALGHLAWF